VTGHETTLRIGVLTDLHLAAPGTPPSRFNNPVYRGHSYQLLGEALRWLGPRSDALLLLGDLADVPSARDYRMLLDELERTGLPVHAVLGNHDIAPVSGPAGATDFIAMTAGRAGAAVAPLGTCYLGDQSIALVSAPLECVDGQGFRHAGVGRALAAVAPSRLMIWAGHPPVLTLRSAVTRRGWTYAGDVLNIDAVEAMLSAHGGPLLALTGHLHIRSHAMKSNILQLGQGALAESPYDAAVITIRCHDRGIDVRRQCHCVAPAAGLGSGRPAVLDPADIAFRWDGAQWRRHALPAEASQGGAPGS
jgi:hypothetical protein